MKTTIITEVCKGIDLEIGDTFYTWKRGVKKKWAVAGTTEGELGYGVAVTKGDNLYFRESDIFIVKEIT